MLTRHGVSSLLEKTLNLSWNLIPILKYKLPMSVMLKAKT